MTQEQNSRSSTSKRTSRPAQNRPMLITSPTQTGSMTDEQAVQVSSDTSQPAEEAPTDQPTESPRTRKLPGFFSRVGKSAQAETPEADPAQARLVRATRGRAGTSPAPTVPDKKEEVREPVKARTPVSDRTSPTRPRSGFKMRYIWGMAIYLLGAQLIGAYEASFIRPIDHILFSIGPVNITISTLVFLATLIILLLVLARFDLIPRNLGAMMGQSTSTRRASSAQSQKTQESVKTPPPPMKQGVKGADDDLYQEYREQRRYQQRRDRKR